MTRRILVTGGAGFLGNHLCRRLLADGHEVFCLDNLATGRRPAPDVQAQPRFSFVRGDVTALAVTGGFDEVFHLASPASPKDYARMPVETLRAGATGTYEVLEAARRADARFLLASTSEVYGDPMEHPQRESYHGNVSPTGPRSVYDEAKRFAEAITMAYHRHHGLETRIARIFNTYGPGMRADDGRVLCTFLHQAIHGFPLTVFGDGSQTRSLCHVEDMVHGLAALMERGDAGPCNLGNPEEVSVLELAHLVLRETGSASPIEHRPLPQDDPRRRRPDITRARGLLGWEPRVPLAEGLRRMVTHVRAGGLQEVLA